MTPEVALRVAGISAAGRAISEAVACLPLCVYAGDDGADASCQGALRRALLTPEERTQGLTVEFDEYDMSRVSLAGRAAAY